MPLSAYDARKRRQKDYSRTLWAASLIVCTAALVAVWAFFHFGWRENPTTGAVNPVMGTSVDDGTKWTEVNPRMLVGGGLAGDPILDVPETLGSDVAAEEPMAPTTKEEPDPIEKLSETLKVKPGLVENMPTQPPDWEKGITGGFYNYTPAETAANTGEV